MSVGTYDDATRFPFQSPVNPGLTFAGNGRGNNTLTGSFKVLDVTYGVNGTVLSFAADFVQYDEGMLNRWNVGSIRYNSDIPVASVPEPSGLVLFGLAAAAVLPIARRCKAA